MFKVSRIGLSIGVAILSAALQAAWNMIVGATNGATAVVMLLLFSTALSPADSAGKDTDGIIVKPIPGKMVVLTFDDSCISHATYVGPLLKKYGFGATFYVNECMDRKTSMSWGQIKGLEDMGFEIGNHSSHHGNMGKMSTEACIPEMTGIEENCVKNKISKPTTFCWPVYSVNKGLFPRMLSNGYLFARGGVERPYVPTTDNPFDVPSFTIYNDILQKSPNAFAERAMRAVPGTFVVFCFHGVPDLGHKGVSTDPVLFEKLMEYLKVNNFTVIAMRDMAKYVDATKAYRLMAVGDDHQ